MPDFDQDKTRSSVAGVSAGTALIGVLSQLGDGPTKTIFLLLAPTITIIVSFLWDSLWSEVKQRVADQRIAIQRQKQEELVRRLKMDPSIPEELKKQAQSGLDTLKLLEIRLAEKRVEAIVASSESKEG
jgi:hypothetical protein